MKLKHLKRDRALLMTSILLVLMLGAGMFSGIIGFTLGHAALKGVTQPDIRPSNKSINQQNLKTRGLEVLSEQKMLADAQEVMGIAKAGDDPNQAQFSNDDKPVLVFPIESKDQGIILIVKSAKPEGNNIKIDATLRNQGSQAAKFGQGVLTIRDDQDQPVAASFSGMPTSLAANGKDVGIKILISKGELGTAKTITLNLTDADRKLQLEMTDVPVVAAAPAKPKIKINIPDGQLSTSQDDTPSPTPKASTKASPKPSPGASSPAASPSPSTTAVPSPDDAVAQ
jgi:hypothetical protein